MQEYKKRCEEQRDRNKKLLADFESDLREKGLTNKTISRHLDNVDFYINEYLLREEPYPAEQGVTMINSFLGYFFIYKCMWSTPSTTKTTAASIKKFYKSMFDHGNLQQSDYDFLCSEIREGMPDWQAECAHSMTEKIHSISFERIIV